MSVQRLAETELLGPLVEGQLCFDVGAHVGGHAHAMLALGATRVVAVEPQPWERRKIVSDPRLELLDVAVSDRGGSGLFHVARETYVSTLEDDYRVKVQQHAPYDYIGDFPVKRVTLDWMIARFGLPGFVKVDVEGHERAVLTGLHVPVRALSFEVHDFEPEKAIDCVNILNRLGSYAYRYSPRESYEAEPWNQGMQLAIFGDIYAQLQP